MKIALRILLLPFALPLWIIKFSFDWVVYGGELRVNLKPVIDPIAFYELLIKINNGLQDFNRQNNHQND